MTRRSSVTPASVPPESPSHEKFLSREMNFSGER
jgi:hypothetical protein